MRSSKVSGSSPVKRSRIGSHVIASACPVNPGQMYPHHRRQAGRSQRSAPAVPLRPVHPGPWASSGGAQWCAAPAGSRIVNDGPTVGFGGGVDLDGIEVVDRNPGPRRRAWRDQAPEGAAAEATPNTVEPRSNVETLIAPATYVSDPMPVVTSGFDPRNVTIEAQPSRPARTRHFGDGALPRRVGAASVQRPETNETPAKQGFRSCRRGDLNPHALIGH